MASGGSNFRPPENSRETAKKRWEHSRKSAEVEAGRKNGLKCFLAQCIQCDTIFSVIQSNSYSVI